MQGNFKLWNLKFRRLVKEFPYVYKGGFINHLSVSASNDYLMASGSHGVLLQFSVKKCQLIFNYGKVRKARVNSMCIYQPFSGLKKENEEELLYTGDCWGYLKKWNIITKNLINDYGKIHEFGLQVFFFIFLIINKNSL